jgi:hypothetical protein
LPGIVGLISVPELVIGAKDEHFSAIFDSIRKTRRRVVHLKSGDLCGPDPERLFDVMV